MTKRTRRNHTPAFKAKIALAAICGERPQHIDAIHAGHRDIKEDHMRRPVSTRDRQRLRPAGRGKDFVVGIQRRSDYLCIEFDIIDNKDSSHLNRIQLPDCRENDRDPFLDLGDLA